MPKHWGTGSCILITAAMLASSVPTARAAAPAEEPVAEDNRAVAKQRFAAGLDRYTASDFAGAIEDWTTARESMATDPAVRDAWHVLGLDLAQAHVRAYRLDGNESHFAPTEQLLEEYIAWVDRPGHAMSEAEREDRPRAMEMLEFIADERAARASAPPVAPTPVVRAFSPATPEAAKPPFDHRGAQRSAQILIGTGAASLGLAAGATIGTVLLAVRGPRLAREYEALSAENAATGTDRHDAELDDIARSGRRTNAGFVAFSVSAAVLGVGGIALLTTGLVKRHRALRVAPALGAGHAGVQLRWIF